MAESIDEFFEDEDFHGSPLSGPATAIRAFLSDTSNTPEKAAQELLSSYKAPNAFKLSTIIANMIVPLAEERLETQLPLLKLLAELKGAKPVLQPGDNISLSYELWERGLRYGDPDPVNDLRDLLRQEWTNVNRFAASIHEAGIEDLWSFGEHTLKLALSKGGWRTSWKDTESPSDKIDAFHGHIGAAAEWIFICGRRLYNERESVRGHWPQWQQNLEWIIGQDGLKDESRTLCEEVLVEMRNIMNP